MKMRNNEYTLQNLIELSGLFGDINDGLCEQILSLVFQEIDEIESGKSVKFAGMTAVSSDWLKILVEVSLAHRKKGKLPYYLSTVTASVFMQKNSEDEFIVEAGAYAEEVGLKYALKRYVTVDRCPDLIQLVYEQYNKLSACSAVDEAGRVERLKFVYEAAYQAEVRYHGCSQCILYGLGETLKPVDKIIFKAATGLSGGMAQCGDGACGGYSGGILYMGSFIGRSFDCISNDKENQYRSFSMAQRLHDKYVETYGGMRGMDVQEKMFGEFFLLRDKKQKTAFSNAGAHEYECPCVVGTAARWVAEILMDEGLV